ncbi:MAG TPA: PstS family phosphate ABC transporter substrate-binding protein [Acidimicrobiia bacterium]|nr:PstS family phosphate ABC transporter substrate-binding protein [Acidimicrobiia bacterium]
MKLRFTRTIALVGVLALVLAACGGDAGGDGETDATDAPDITASDETPDEGDGGTGELTGEVRLDGSSTVGPLSEVAAELYMTESQPDVRVTVAISGTGGGFEKFCNGETDGNNSSRPITDDEAERCGENGIAYDFVQVANDALSIVVNADLPVECMTVEQVNQIWDEGSTVEIWGDVDGLDLPDDVASQTLTPYGPGSDSGTFDYFTDEVNGEEGRIRNDYIDIGEDDLAAVRAVTDDPYAMGYIPFSYFQEAGDAVKALAIDDGNGCVESTIETVQNQTYTPLGRGLFVYFSDTALSRPEVLDFAEFYVENAAQIAELAEFVPMTPEQLEEQSAKVGALAGG